MEVEDASEACHWFSLGLEDFPALPLGTIELMMSIAQLWGVLLRSSLEIPGCEPFDAVGPSVVYPLEPYLRFVAT